MTTGALDLPDTSRLEDDDAKDEPRKALWAYRHAHHHHPAQGHTADYEALTEHTPEVVAGVQRVAAFVLVGAEPCTRLLLERPYEGGTQVLLPVLGPRLARCWELSQDDAGLVERAPRRPPELSGPSMPVETVGRADAPIISAPVVDSIGRRLGQSGGWYDRMLPLRSPEAHTFTVFHPEELVPGPLPMEEHDELVDAVITAQEWLLLAVGSPAHAMSPEF